jgi:hypothetical protein
MLMRDFLDQTTDEKLYNIRQYGVYIGKCKFDDFVVVLYQINEFYIEIYYDSYRLHINKFNCFTSTEFLDPYLEKIEIDYLFKN